MILPSDDECRRVVLDLADCGELNSFEYDFCDSNLTRREFTTKQKEVIARLKEKYDT